MSSADSVGDGVASGVGSAVGLPVEAGSSAEHDPSKRLMAMAVTKTARPRT